MKKLNHIKHPYESLQEHPLWQVVDKCINDLSKNKDLSEMTRREYIVGYIVKELLNSNFEKHKPNVSG
ncbi:MAG: hypothetical protein HQM08_30645 [Candidatus Riflebacteria bacterium]|nr:hypothetical protein [Candidatus Riflebacteria bacterium]